jgi:hypothetical protein
MSETGRFIRNVLLKALLLLLAANAVFVLVRPLAALGRISLYNLLVPGRLRLPYGEHPDSDHNLSLFNLDAMFYNLGYPTMSVTKDLLMMRYALRYRPDLIIWLVTLESLPQEKQFDSPILQHNAAEVRRLIDEYQLHADPADPRLITPTFWDQTIPGQRRALADLVRLQVYGFLWAATGVDQSFPAHNDPPQKDLDADPSFHGLMPPVLESYALALDVLGAGREMAGGIPMWIVNEPIYISSGRNSDIRYNFFYPRWAYDQYRVLLADWCRDHNVYFLDAWDAVPAADFSNSAIHRTPKGEALMADRLEAAILERKNVH